MCKDKLISKNQHQKLYYKNILKMVTNQVHGSAKLYIISHILLTLETSQQEYYNQKRAGTEQARQLRNE